MSSARSLADGGLTDYNSIWVGNYLSAVLYGLTTLQVYVYWRAFPKDRLTIKLLVVTLLALETLLSGFSTYAAYQVSLIPMMSLISEVSLQKVVSALTRAAATIVLLTSINDTIIRGFYCLRLYRINGHKKLLSAIIAIPVVTSFVLGLVVSVRGYQSTSSEFVSSTGTNKILICALIVSITIADGAIAVSLSYLLWKERRILTRRTSAILSTVIAYTVATGLLTSVTALTIIIVLLTVDGYPYFAIFMTLSKLYFNAFLVTLNNRTALRRADELPATTISLHIAEGRTYSRSEQIGFSQQDLEDGLEFTIATQPDAHEDGEETPEEQSTLNSSSDWIPPKSAV